MGLTIYKRGAELEGGDKEWGTVNLEVGGVVSFIVGILTLA